MRVLVLGATGLIGSHVLRALRSAGFAAIGAARAKPATVSDQAWATLDFGTLTSPDAWHPYLTAFDAVVNCVGIIREAAPGDFERLHRAAPIALFAACERAGIQVVQISALGSAVDAETPYWRSKGAADDDLLQRRMTAHIVRPSLVYGADGASSRLFLMLATLPAILLPMAHAARVQPIHIDDLAAVIVRLLGDDGDRDGDPDRNGDRDAQRARVADKGGSGGGIDARGGVAAAAPMRVIAAVGPRPFTLAAYLATLRQGMGGAPARVFALPTPLAKIVARCAALLPGSAFTPDALTMLEKSADGSNTADPAAVRLLLGRPLRDPDTFAVPAQRPAAVFDWAGPLLRYAMAALWLITAWVSLFGWPHAVSDAWLAACGIPADLREPMLLAASLADMLFGLALLFFYRRWLWPLQMALVLGYTALLSWFLPEFWLHPFGVLSKNLPLLALMLAMWRLSDK